MMVDNVSKVFVSHFQAMKKSIEPYMVSPSFPIFFFLQALLFFSVLRALL